MIATPLNQIGAAIQARASARRTEVVRRVSIDSRSIDRGDLFFAIRGDRFDGHQFVGDALSAGACAAVVQRDKTKSLQSVDSDRLLFVDDTIAALGRLAAWHRKKSTAHVVAVTGSNGKTTVKNMITQVLGTKFSVAAARASFNNQIGVPLTLLSCEAHHDYVVVEIGTNAPGEVAALAQIASPDVGVITSVGHAHLEGLGDIEGVRREKLSLLSHTRDTAVVHDDAAGAELVESFGLKRIIRFGQSPAADVRVTDIDSSPAQTFARLSSGVSFTIPLAGAHNAVNAAAAMTVATDAGVDPAESAEALATFAPPAMRMAYEQVGDITLIRDCYNANPSSMRAAIDVLAQAAGRRVLIVGEMAELGVASKRFHRQIGEYAAQMRIDLVGSVGRAAAPAAAAFKVASPGAGCLRFDSTADAVKRLPHELVAGDTVLIKGSRVAGLEAVAEAIRSDASRFALARG